MGLASSSSLLIDRSDRTNVKKETVKTVSWWGNITRSSTEIRSADVESRLIVPTLVKSCKNVGDAPMITIETDDTYSLTCTLDTEIYGADGWIAVDRLSQGDTIYTNGYPEDGAWRDYDTLRELYVDKDLTMKEVGDILGVSEHTIRKWVRKHKLGKGISGSLYGAENPNFRGGDVSRDGGYQRMNVVVEELGLRTGFCSTCDATGDDLHIHHIDHNPLNNDPSNLIEICSTCHRVEHVGYTIKHIKRSEITEVYLSGTQNAYKVCTEKGAFVSEGFIVSG